MERQVAPVATLIALLSTPAAAQRSAFNAYTAFLEPVRTTYACRLDDTSYFENLTYRLRGDSYPRNVPLPMRNGTYEDDVFIKGRPEWITTLEQQVRFSLGQIPALLLRLNANHVAGTGSFDHVVIMRCRGNRLDIVFEASGAGVKAGYLPDAGLEVRHVFWLPQDSHASPSRLVTENYRWDGSRGRFDLAGKTEGAVDQTQWR
jgi:hypothetical protein